MVIGGLVYTGGSLLFPPKQPCANSKTCQSDLSEKIENGAKGTFMGRQVIAPPVDLAMDNRQTAVLGSSVPAGPKHIYIDLSTQMLYAYEGDNKVFQAVVSTGKWNKTPVGNFNIWTKLRSTRMSGGEGADYYNLPNVQYVMYFYHDFGLHTAYWHDNFGHPMSHGCINMRLIDAETLYNWADGPKGKQQGTAVSVCNQFTEPNNCVQVDPVN